jgi:hypothetical protein
MLRSHLYQIGAYFLEQVEQIGLVYRRQASRKWYCSHLYQEVVYLLEEAECYYACYRLSSTRYQEVVDSLEQMESMGPVCRRCLAMSQEVKRATGGQIPPRVS